MLMLDLRFFGGRGAASGVSDAGKRYGSEYTTLHSEGNIKFVRRTDGNASAPLETMSKGRIYVTVNNANELKYISYYNADNKKFKQIDLDHTHYVDGLPTRPHTHKGYLHSENGSFNPSFSEKRLIERVMKKWYNRQGQM